MEEISAIQGNIHSIETFGALEGPGIRYVAFLQGCPLHCLYCHNPDTWAAAGGRFVTAGELFQDILQYRNFIARGGVTLSGGEPLLQAEFCHAVLQLCKQEKIHTAIDTSGCIPLSRSRCCIDTADLILLDMKAVSPDLCQKITGQDNRNAIETLNYCEKIGRSVWIRHVVVPGLTMVPEQLADLAKFLKGYSCIKRVDLLPFHKLGAYKWEQLQLPFSLQDTPIPDAEEILQIKEQFLKEGLPIPQ